LCENVKESGEIERVSFIFHHHREPPISTWIVVVEAAIVHFLQVEELLELVSEKERDHLWFASMGEERETLFKVFSCKENKQGIGKRQSSHSSSSFRFVGIRMAICPPPCFVELVL